MTYIKLLRHHYENWASKPETTGGGQGHTRSDSAHIIFSLSDQFGLGFEARHMALCYFDKVTRKLAKTTAESSRRPIRTSWFSGGRGSSGDTSREKLKQVLLRRALSCVQIGSKGDNIHKGVWPKHIHAKYPQISKLEALEGECETLRLLNFDLSLLNSPASCLEVLTAALADVGIIGQSSRVLNVSRTMLDFVCLSPPGGEQLMGNAMFLSGCIVCAAVYVCRAAIVGRRRSGMKATTNALQVMTGARVRDTARRARDILRQMCH